MPLVSMASRQHWPLVAIQRGAEHLFMAISPTPPVAARPRPARIGAKPAAPRLRPPAAWATAPLAARRAKPPE